MHFSTRLIPRDSHPSAFRRFKVSTQGKLEQLFEQIVRTLILTTIAIGVVACSPLKPTDTPPDLLLTWLEECRPEDQQEYERTQGRVRIVSPYISGTFTAILIRRNGVSPAVRLQLYPELGGRVLDLVANPTSFTGIIPQDDLEVSWSTEDGKPPRHFLAFLAASLIEEGNSLCAARATGAAPGPDHTWRVGLTPTFEELELVAVFNARGALVRKEYDLRGVKWRQLARRPRCLIGDDFELRVLEETATPTEPLDDALFRLELPGESDDQ